MVRFIHFTKEQFASQWETSREKYGSITNLVGFEIVDMYQGKSSGQRKGSPL